MNSFLFQLLNNLMPKMIESGFDGKFVTVRQCHPPCEFETGVIPDDGYGEFIDNLLLSTSVNNNRNTAAAGQRSPNIETVQVYCPRGDKHDDLAGRLLNAIESSNSGVIWVTRGASGLWPLIIR